MADAWVEHHSPGMTTPSNDEMQRTRHSQNGASPLISVLDGPRVVSMQGSPARASRWGGRSAAVSLLVLAVVSPSTAVSDAIAALEECEPALGKLISTLESKRQLSGPKARYKGAALGPEYSKCRVNLERPSWPHYAVFRSSDDTTVIIEKHASERQEPVLYGPFQSAYRK